jgi:GxxExxY protein
MHHAIPPETDAIGQQAIVVGLRVHSALGAGLLEPAYEHCLAHELTLRGIDNPWQGTALDAGYRIDLLAGESAIIEIKCVDALTPTHQAQLLTYLRLPSFRLAFSYEFQSSSFQG